MITTAQATTKSAICSNAKIVAMKCFSEATKWQPERKAPILSLRMRSKYRIENLKEEANRLFLLNSRYSDRKPSDSPHSTSASLTVTSLRRMYLEIRRDRKAAPYRLKHQRYKP